MKKKRTFLLRLSFLVAILTLAVPALGWYEETHMAVAKAAGYNKWHNAAGADIARIKAGNIESYNHYFNNNNAAEVTPEIVLEQAGKYNDPSDTEGHLYGAIVASLRQYRERVSIRAQYPGHYFAYTAHYIGDLSNPLHNIPYDDFNKARHADNDGVVENEVLANVQKIDGLIHPVELRPEHFEEDLAKEIAKIANGARQLGYALKKENRNMTKEEAYIQLGHSASLLKAILKHFSKADSKRLEQ
ncbi:MAG: hypothetical protein C4526_05560 [Nitrospiraceae bacterium]|nr:MAG: hypothetical protein C4526_05560 [Nitrospiraceae bacterium]